MKFFLLLVACLFLESSATLLLKKAALLNLAGLGDPCNTNDKPCCKNKFSKLVPILINHLGSPLIIPKLKVGYGKGVLQLDQTLDHLKIEGLNKATVTDSNLNLPVGKLDLSLHAKELKLVTKYNINGRCLALPIWGRGDGVITLKNVDIKMDMAVGLDNANLCLHNVKMLIKAGGINFKFSSLFGEIRKKILTPEFEKIFNDNGMLVLNDLLPGYTNALEKHLSIVLKPVLDTVPLNAILLAPVLSG